MEYTRKLGFLNLTVLEHFSDMDLVHVHYKQQINLDCLPHIRSLGKLLFSRSEILKNRTYRLYYVLPQFGMILPLDDNISYDVFFDWLFYKSVNNVYAVIENLTTTDFKKVVTLYLKQLPSLDIGPVNRIFKQTIAKPFSHRPMEPELNSPDAPPSRKRSKDIYLKEYPCEIDIYFIHNHLLNNAEALRHRHPTEELETIFSEYYSNNHSPSSALEMYKIDLQSKHGDEYLKIIADGSKCPTRKWCYDLYYKIICN